MMLIEAHWRRRGVVFLRLDEMFHQTNLCIMGPSDKWITSIMSMFATKSIDLDMKALDQRHTYPLHCLPKSTNHFQYRKWRNRLQKVVEKQVLPIFPVQYTSLLSQWGYNNKAISEAHLLTDLPLLNAALMNSSREHAIPLVGWFPLCHS